jgi:hypothetical protein
MKLLDNGLTVVLFKNEMNSYTAVGVTAAASATLGLNDAMERALENDEETDDFTPSQALYRLTEKLTTRRIA